MFPFGSPVSLLRKQNDGTFAAGVTFAHCAVEPRREAEAPVPSWPPLAAGRTLYDTSASLVAAARDRIVVLGVTYEVDGDTEVWESPYTGQQLGTVTYLRRTDNWFDTTVSVKTYLGSSGFGPSWAATATWPASIVAVSQLDSSAVGDEFDSQVKVRVPAALGGTAAVDVFTVGSELTVAGAVSTVSTVQPVTRDGVTEFVEVSAK